ncbi:hypothetical protein FSOLCH5_012755 [Fusarium solani]
MSLSGDALEVKAKYSSPSTMRLDTPHARKHSTAPQLSATTLDAIYNLYQTATNDTVRPEYRVLGPSSPRFPRISAFVHLQHAPFRRTLPGTWRRELLHLESDPIEPEYRMCHQNSLHEMLGQPGDCWICNHVAPRWLFSVWATATGTSDQQLPGHTCLRRDGS